MGYFFSDYRKASESLPEDASHVECIEQKNGKEYVNGLIKQHELTFQKKIPFERGQYH